MEDQSRSRTWTLHYENVAPRHEGLREALCTLGNGYFATRGAAPESHADGVHYPATYIAGCFNELRTEIAGGVSIYELVYTQLQLAEASPPSVFRYDDLLAKSLHQQRRERHDVL